MKRLALLGLTVLMAATLLVTALRVTAQPDESATAAAPSRQSYVLERDIDLGSATGSIYRAALHPQGALLFLIRSADGVLLEVNLNSGTVTEIPMPSYLNSHLLFNADGSHLYAIANPYYMVSGTLTVVDTAAGQVLTSTDILVPAEDDFNAPAVGPNDRLYLPQRNAIHTLDATNGAVLASTPVSGTDDFDRFELAANPAGAVLYAVAQPPTGLFVRYAISSSLPVEIDRSATDYYSERILLTPDESSIHALGTFWPGPYGIGRLTTDTYALQQVLTGTALYVDYQIDPASEYLYAMQHSVGHVDIYDAHTGEQLGTFADPDVQEEPEAVFGLPNGRFATLIDFGNSHRIRIFKPATHFAYLPISFYNYCSNHLYDDFSDPASGWPIGAGPNFIYGYVGGEYNIHHLNENYWTAVTAGHEWDGRTVQVDGRVNAGSGVWGLILGIAPNWTNFFTFEIEPATGNWWLLRYSNIVGWDVINSGNSSQVNPGSNTLRASGTNFYINGVWTTDFYGMNPYGRVGFTSAGFEDGADFRYDDYYFVRRNCPEPPGTLAPEVAPAFVARERGVMAPGE